MENSNINYALRMIYSLSLGYLLFICSCQGCQRKQAAPNIDPYGALLTFAVEHLPKTGKLVQAADGFAYIKVDDRYIHDLFAMLENTNGFEKAPYFRKSNSPGAHISVFYEDEHVVANEAGESFNFTLKDIVIVSPKKTLSYLILTVHAPELEKLRRKYGLEPRLNDQEFHITIARKIDRHGQK